MGDLKNEVAWSISRALAFARCDRELYWKAFGHWNGWNRDKAPPFAWDAYHLGKMKNLPMLVGELVHHAIEDVLKARQMGWPVPNAETGKKKLRDRLRQTWKESKAREWEKSPRKYGHLAEIYYGQEPSKENCEMWRDRAFAAIDQFHALPLTRTLLESPRESFKAIEAQFKFQCGEWPINGKIDLAWEHEGRLHLIDWKTGAQDEDVDYQLSVYALYAMDAFQVPLEKIRAYAVYLRDGSVGESCVTEESLSRVREVIGRYFSTVAPRVTAGEELVANMELFAMAEDWAKCERCFYRELCGRVEGPPKS
ncbi:MAG: PD-(D/E)XK nuclease family protein [Verrucomicrobiae bacterium]|nr:PD-(D/E)XK nuclease family protein [Verrucomicrobiae bacterium]